MTGILEFLELFGNKWDSCYVNVFQVDPANSSNKEIEEVVKISIVEEINNFLLENNYYVIGFFRKFNEIVLAFNHPMQGIPNQEIEISLKQGCIQIISKYLHEPLLVGSSHQEYALQHLSEAYDNAIQDFVYENEKKAALGSLEKTNDQQNILISKAIDFCKQYYSSDISLQKASEYLNINKFYFCSLFKESLDVTFWEYITTLRISQAKELLQNTPNKVGDIALQIGYINSSHFGRIFKET
ncbi:MAG: helix-turn-helix transcriptional regulator, partial [Gorillibacterium sp.]|nr:helix-turn-helix transcriptional regulator [Gorillibacterium sp.]